MFLKTSCKLFKTIRFTPFQRVLCEVQPSHLFACKNCNARPLSTAVNRQPDREIYYGALTPQIKAVKIFSLTSSLVGIIAQPFLYREIVSTGNVPIIVGAYTFIGFFTFLTPLLLHFITKKYVTHLTYNAKKGTYTAQTVSFFCTTQNTEFKPEEVTAPDVPGMFTTLIVRRKALFLDPRLFEHPEHYAKIMGLDKPMDFKLYETPPDKTKAA